jgi:hypothetical protein
VLESYDVGNNFALIFFLGLEFRVYFAKCVEVKHSLKWVVEAKRDICLLSLSLSFIYISQRAPDFLCLAIKRQNIGWCNMQADRYATVVHICLLGPELFSLAWVFWNICLTHVKLLGFSFNHFKTKRKTRFVSSFANAFNYVILIWFVLILVTDVRYFSLDEIH